MKLLAPLALGALIACAAAITPIAYNPNPARIANPAEEAKQLILANVVQGCVAEPEVTETMLTVKFVCSSGVGNSVVRFDKVESIVMDESGGWFRVQVLHRDGAAPFQWTSKSLDDMQRLADALTALSGAPAAAPAKNTTI